VGMANNFSLGGGMIPLFLFAGAPTPVWLVPKFSIPVSKDKLNVGTGAFLATILGEDSGILGLLYETTTVGTRDQNASLGIAYGFNDGNWMKRPIFNFSTMMRSGPRGYFITENYLIPYKKYENSLTQPNGTEQYAYACIISLGGRTIIRNVGLDYSLWMPFNTESDEFFALPFLGITVPIGKRSSAR
jgi:hypothetical protein